MDTSRDGDIKESKFLQRELGLEVNTQMNIKQAVRKR
jgi:hypothetical protein